jgi:Fe-S oxidoreductase
MHLIFAGPNIYFFRRERMGLPPAIDFEKSEKFGIDRFQELPWKTLLDTYACTECGRCNSVCPAHLTGKPLQPMKVLHDIKVNLRGDNGRELLALRDRFGRPLPEKAEAEAALEPNAALVARGPVERSKPGAVRADGKYLEVDGQVHLDELWACTSCAACAQICPVTIDSVPGTLIGLRQNLVMMESEFPKELTAAFKGMEVQGNPWGVGQDKREDWARELDVPVMAQIAAEDPAREVQYLFWVGCAGATDDRVKKVQQALVRVLKAAKVDFAILGCEEKCTGDPARRMGNEYVWSSLAQENVATLSQYKFKKIFTTCPHCFNQLKNEYPELGGHYTVQHHSELLAELLRDKRVPLDTRRALDEHVTFHDPCYLGRYNKSYEAPREVLLQIQVRSREMPRSRESSFCCGAGGGRMFMEEASPRVNEIRTQEIIETGVGMAAVACPFCTIMITDGTKLKDVEEKLKVMELSEIVAKVMKQPAEAAEVPPPTEADGEKPAEDAPASA